MEKNSKQSESVKDGKDKPLTIGEMEKMLKRDIQSAFLLLQALNEDVNTQKAISTFLHGQYLNRRHQEELAKQEQLDIKV